MGGDVGGWGGGDAGVFPGELVERGRKRVVSERGICRLEKWIMGIGNELGLRER